MKIHALVATVALLAASLPAYATCDIKQADEDKQAKCAEKCDDSFLRNKMNYGADIPKLAEEKKACDTACGCPQNSN